MDKWDLRFLELAKLVSAWSKDQSSKMGACIVGQRHEILSVGYNGMCRGINDDVPERNQRPLKYKWFEHAERNAIFNAAANGVRLAGSTIYAVCAPCCDCARSIIQSGIARCVCYEPSDDIKSRWGEDFVIIESMFKEAGITYEQVK